MGRRCDEGAMRDHLATLLDDFRRFDRGIAVVRTQGNRRRVTTYAEIAKLAARFAALLEQRGIGPGDRVVLWAENSAEWVAAFYGMMLRGVLAVPLDAYGTAEFAARVAADVKPQLVVGDFALVRKLPADWPQLAFEEWASSLPTEEAGPVAGLNKDTPLQILFTSGTTGDPKGIVHTHGNVLASVEPIEQGARPYLRYEKLFHPLRILHTLPLSHVFGQTMGLWVPAFFASEVHFENRIVAPRLLEKIKQDRISVLAAVPRVFALMKTHLESIWPGLTERSAAAAKKRGGKWGWKRWFWFGGVHRAFGFKFWALVSGGGALPGPLEQFWNSLGFVVVQGYGMTESTALITLNHPFHAAAGSIGKPLPGRELKIGPDGEVLVRGAMISNATWSGGALKTREDEWLATGDIAEKQSTGDLKFLGRKSEVIVTASGVNIHPEDLESAIEQEPGVAGCAVVALDTPNGPEPYAVLAVRGAADQAAAAVEHANTKLAEFQRVRRWALWPEPDLPRTSTGKVRRKPVAEWVAGVKAAAEGGATGNGLKLAASGDWLLSMIARITDEVPPGAADDLRLSEDLHLDSLGRVQLASSLEEKLGELPGDGAIDKVQTLGELRKLIGGENGRGHESTVNQQKNDSAANVTEVGRNGHTPQSAAPAETDNLPPQTIIADHTAEEAEREEYLYPRWPWWKPVAWVRVLFIEGVVRTLVRELAKPRVTGRPRLERAEPVLIVSNHVTAYDGPLVQYALPGAVRRRVAVAMAGEMIEDYRHFRNPDGVPGKKKFMLLGPLTYFLITALFNVFPLPRRRDFQRSFAHAGDALDHGYSVLVFPEGARSAEGELARFRPGIGLLVKQSQTAVLPVAIRGLGALKGLKFRERFRGWFRTGALEVRVGEPLRFAAEETEAAITQRLHDEVERLLKQ
jgi:long-chain acyl-CoA synthetase